VLVDVSGVVTRGCVIARHLSLFKK